MNSLDKLTHLTPSTEILTADESLLIAPFFTNADRSVVAIKNLPEAVKGALFSRYSRSSKGVRRLFLDEFYAQHDLGIDVQTIQSPSTSTASNADAFYRRVLSDYGDDSVGELGGAHLACQEISQIAARVIEDGRVGISYLEKSSRYVPFDDRVNGQFRYYRPRRILESRFADEYVATMDGLFEAYSKHLPMMMERIAARTPIESLEFENALTGETARFENIRDDDFRKSAEFAYRQSVRARAFDALRCFLPMATLTNVGVWGNGRALEYLLTKAFSYPLDEVQTIALAAYHELDQVIGAFVRRANDERGKTYQAFLNDMRTTQRALAEKFLPLRTSTPQAKVTLVRYDVDAMDQVVASILYPGSNAPKQEILARVRQMNAVEKMGVVRAYIGERQNRRHKPGRAFERAVYEFDLALNIGEYRDLQRHRIVSPDRQMFTTLLGFEINDDVSAVPEIRDDYARHMERAAKLYTSLADEMLFEAQYVVPFGYRVRYNVQMNLREAYHWIELRSQPQGHPDYRRTSQEMFRAVQVVHPQLIEAMQFVNLEPDVPIGRLRAEMRKASKSK